MSAEVYRIRNYRKNAYQLKLEKDNPRSLKDIQAGKHQKMRRVQASGEFFCSVLSPQHSALIITDT